MAQGFAGFRNTLAFLDELGDHNDREWFAANKERYESCVMEPALAFIAAMRPSLAKFAPEFEAIPKRMGRSVQ